MLVIKVHSNIAHTDRERIIVTSFMLGVVDRQLVAFLALASN